jgi:hypothetical protein
VIRASRPPAANNRPASRPAHGRLGVVLDQVLAVAVPVIHFAFVVVLVGGAFVVWRHPRLWKVHLPAVLAMTAVAAAGADCPLTDLEDHFRERAGWPPHHTGFISHYLVEPWHPAGITTPIQLGIIAIWIVPNVIAYVSVVRWAHHRRVERHAAWGQPPPSI